jgi:hypothetical protein
MEQRVAIKRHAARCGVSHCERSFHVVKSHHKLRERRIRECIESDADCRQQRAAGDERRRCRVSEPLC